MGAGASFFGLFFSKSIIPVLLLHPQNISSNISYQECLEDLGNQSFFRRARTPGLKPESTVDALRSAEVPLFDVTAGIRFSYPFLKQSPPKPHLTPSNGGRSAGCLRGLGGSACGVGLL